MATQETDLHDRIVTLMARLEALLSAPVLDLGEVVLLGPSRAHVEGVYVVSLPADPARVVYVGRTKSKTIHGRLKDHLSIETSSDLKGILKRWPDFPPQPSKYGARWVEMTDPRERALLEFFAIAVLQPTFNRV